MVNQITRVSISADDPGFTDPAMWEVEIDGVKRDDVVTADSASGQALVYSRDSAGRFITDPKHGGPQTEWVTGAVVLLPHPRWTPPQWRR